MANGADPPTSIQIHMHKNSLTDCVFIYTILTMAVTEDTLYLSRLSRERRTRKKGEGSNIR